MDQHESSFYLYLSPNLSNRLLALGVGLCLIGLIGIILPKVLSIAVSMVIAGMLILAGIILFLFTKITEQQDRMSWIKCLTPLLLGIFLAIKPFALIVVLGLVVFFYFILDGAASITLALEMKPRSGWLLLFISGVISLSLAGIFIVFWPYSTHWYLGFMIGLSLFLDGLFLIILSRIAKSC